MITRFIFIIAAFLLFAVLATAPPNACASDSFSNLLLLQNEAILLLPDAPQESAKRLKNCSLVAKSLIRKTEDPSEKQWLDRRIAFWNAAGNALLFECENNAVFLNASVIDVKHLFKLRDKTQETKESLLNAPPQQQLDTWILFLGLDDFLDKIEQLISHLAEAAHLPDVESLRSVSADAKAIFEFLNSGKLTQQQFGVFSLEPRKSWMLELEKWTGETTRPSELLRSILTYETSGGFTNARDVATILNGFATSKNPAFSALANSTKTLYLGANIRFFVSERLINELMPELKPERSPFRQTILGKQVDGSRFAESQVSIRLIPDDKYLRFSLNIDGKVVANGKSQTKPVSVLSSSIANFHGSKEIVFLEEGFVTRPANVSVRNSVHFRGTDSSMNAPILSGIGSSIARNYFETNRHEISAESRAAVVRETQGQINRDVDKQFVSLNDGMQNVVIPATQRLGLSLELNEPRTDENWLLSSWLLNSKNGLGGHSLPPETPFGAFADVKVHESAIHAILDGLDIAGKTLSVKELREILHERFNTEFPWVGNEDDDNVLIALAERNPITVRFLDNKIEIALAVSLLKKDKAAWRDFHILATYRPAVLDDGSCVLVRDAIINVSGQHNLRTQIPLRTLVARLFPAQRPVSLVPKFMETDSRFVDFTTGLCRIENGWIAVAIVYDSE